MTQLTFDIVQERVNYVVRVQDWNGLKITECETEEEAWEAIGKRSFGGLYSVSSPTNKDTYQFIPY